MVATVQVVQHLTNAALAVVFVVADLGGCDLKMLEQLASVSGIFGGDQVYGLQQAHGPKGHVFEVAQGGAHHVEMARLGVGLGVSVAIGVGGRGHGQWDNRGLLKG